MTRKLFSGNACTIAVNNIPIVYYTYLVPARNTQSNKNKMEMPFYTTIIHKIVPVWPGKIHLLVSKKIQDR